MRFIKVNDQTLVAVDTIAEIRDLKESETVLESGGEGFRRITQTIKCWEFTIVTKRGHPYEGVVLDQASFRNLTGGV